MAENKENASNKPEASTGKSPTSKRRIILAVIAVVMFLLVILIAQLTRGDGLNEEPASNNTSQSEEQSPQINNSSDDAGQADDDTQTSEASTANQAYQDSPMATRVADDPMAIGDVDAPVVMVEWTDLACRYCGVFSRDVLPQLKEEYVDTGLVRIEIQTVSFVSPDYSEIGAVAAQAAAKQGKGVEFMEAAYQAAPEDEEPQLTTDVLISLAQTAGVPDLEAFEKDLSSEELQSKVANATLIAQQYGIAGAPAFNTELKAFTGAQPFEVFQELLDDSLTRAGATPPSSAQSES